MQVIPHITDEIKARDPRRGGRTSDVAIIEIGGTVGDIECLPFLEAIRQFAPDAGKENVLYIHVTLVPVHPRRRRAQDQAHPALGQELREIGIQPDMLLCRTEIAALARTVKDKIALFCNVRVGGGHRAPRRGSPSTRCP